MQNLGRVTDFINCENYLLSCIVNYGKHASSKFQQQPHWKF